MDDIIFINSKKKDFISEKIHLSNEEIINRLKPNIISKIFFFDTINFINIDRSKTYIMIFLNPAKKRKKGFYYKNFWISGDAIICRILIEKNIEDKESENQFIFQDLDLKDELLWDNLKTFVSFESKNISEIDKISRAILNILREKDISVFRYSMNSQLKIVCIADLVFDIRKKTDAYLKCRNLYDNIKEMSSEEIEEFFYYYVKV